ncbi:MAG: 30S ribosome-binding factor RbfA [Verrucomicrobia bacterium]|nr:30S ribosome-binding factor RbfA [Verrucomicrobiota bacterium]
MKNRPLRVQELIRSELGQLILRELRFTAKLVSIHSVSVTPDLRHAHIYMSVIGTPAEQQEALTKLQDNRSMLQSGLAKRVILKYTPQLAFHLTNSIERGVRVVELLDDLHIPPAEDERPEYEVR